MALPSTLQEAIIYFADPTNCNEFLASLRWADGKVECPYCGSKNVAYLASQNRYKCYGKHEKATEAAKRMEVYKNRTFELSGHLKQIMQDRTLIENKSPISKDIETETLNKLVILALEIDADQSQPEGFGSTALGMLTMKMLLLQRDTINAMAYAIEQLEKRVGSPSTK